MIPAVRIEFLLKEEARARHETSQGYRIQWLSDVYTTDAKIEVPLESENFPLHEHLCKTESGRDWFTHYQQYYAYGSTAPPTLFVTVRHMPFQELRYRADHEEDPLDLPIRRAERDEHRMRIISLDASAALVDIRFTHTGKPTAIDTLHFPAIQKYVRDNRGNVYLYHADGEDDREYCILGKVMRKNFKKGWSCFDWFEGVTRNNPVCKLEPPLDHWVEQSLAKDLAASSPYHEKTLAVRLQLTSSER